MCYVFERIFEPRCGKVEFLLPIFQVVPLSLRLSLSCRISCALQVWRLCLPGCGPLDTSGSRSKELFRLALEIFPNVNTLSIQGEGGDCRMALSIPKFQQIMAAASNKLPLTIAIQGSEQSNGNIAALSFAPAPVIEARPKHLRIRGFGAEDQVVED